MEKESRAKEEMGRRESNGGLGKRSGKEYRKKRRERMQPLKWTVKRQECKLACLRTRNLAETKRYKWRPT